MVFPVESEPLSPPLRDTVDAVPSEADDPPAIASISDVHGYLEDARQALLTLEDHPEYDPVVTADSDGRLHWADKNYVLLFNGDLVDRGPNNEAVLEMVARLIGEAPPGRVRVTLGNHEWMIMLPENFQFADWYSTTVSDDERRQYFQWIAEGHVVAAYQGYGHTYAHAGAPEAYDVSAVNETLVEAAAELESAVGTPEDSVLQSELPEQYPAVLGTGDRGVKGPTAGLVWIKFDHLDSDSPPQIVGHTRQSRPTTKGTVHCQDLILNNRDSPGGQGVFVETPDSLTALRRDETQNVIPEALS
jgi:hypothetical protein